MLRGVCGLEREVAQKVSVAYEYLAKKCGLLLDNVLAVGRKVSLAEGCLCANLSLLEGQLSLTLRRLSSANPSGVPRGRESRVSSVGRPVLLL